MDSKEPSSLSHKHFGKRKKTERKDMKANIEEGHY